MQGDRSADRYIEPHSQVGQSRTRCVEQATTKTKLEIPFAGKARSSLLAPIVSRNTCHYPFQFALLNTGYRFVRAHPYTLRWFGRQRQFDFEAEPCEV